MEIFLFWIALSIVVGVAANARGRDGIGWFLLAVFFTPVITLLLVLVMKRKDIPPAFPAHQSAGPFLAQGVLAGIPYRSMPDGAVEAVMQGAAVRFANYRSFADAIGAPIPPPIPPEQPLHRWTRET